MRRFLDLLRQFPKRHVLVIGDLMLDRFIWGEVARLSPEAPVPVLRVTAESFRLGGAANVVHNIRSLGGHATVCGVVGDDAAGTRIIEGLRRIGASTAGVIREVEHQSIQKTRVIARPRHQQIVRLDRENDRGMLPRTLERLRRFVLRNASRVDAVVISDYGKGVVHEAFLDSLAEIAGRKRLVSVIDPKRENYGRYRRATLVTPNKDEAGEASGVPIRDESTLVAAGEKLVAMWRAEAVLITRGPEGMSLFRPHRPVRHFPTEPKEIFDVTGAGDTVVAVSALALACGTTFDDAAVIANIAAGLVGDEVGTVAVPLERLKRVIREKT
jgi:D-beta-D-heptose 7-phosphate kinase/D-beta-D-heptose 1-phosphate adenosyltransferase